MPHILKLTFAQQLDHSPIRAATELLHQQFWCWGKDVEYSQGNLLLKYGFTRTPPPSGAKAASLYQMDLDHGVRIVLRGFGIFYGDDRWGGMFLRRGSFLPMLTPHADLRQQVWLVEDLPSLRIPRDAELSTCQRLLNSAIQWMVDYERWVHCSMGAMYRNRMLVPWRKMKQRTVAASQIVLSWQQVQSTFAQRLEEVISTNVPSDRRSRRRRAV